MEVYIHGRHMPSIGYAHVQLQIHFHLNRNHSATENTEHTEKRNGINQSNWLYAVKLYEQTRKKELDFAIPICGSNTLSVASVASVFSVAFFRSFMDTDRLRGRPPVLPRTSGSLVHPGSGRRGGTK